MKITYIFVFLSVALSSDRTIVRRKENKKRYVIFIKSAFYSFEFSRQNSVLDVCTALHRLAKITNPATFFAISLLGSGTTFI